MSDSEGIDPADVAKRAERIRDRIAEAGGDPAHVGIVAVTKGFDASAVTAAVAAGLPMIGENYAQELRSKLAQLAPDTADQIETHFIGQLQSNKVRLLCESVDVWQSVDRTRLISEIARRSPGARVFLQLDIGGAPSQGGCPLSEAPSLLRDARAAGLEVQGCMAIGPQAAPSEIQSAFGEIERFADAHDLWHRCMGMSADLEQAIRAGSTLVRIGTALFGPRPQRVAHSGRN